jgi:hypothetical protein
MTHFISSDIPHYLDWLYMDGVEVCVINGDLHIDEMGKVLRQDERSEIMEKAEEIKPYAIWLEQQRQDDPKMLDLGKPIKTFYANLLFQGIVLTVKDGQLKVNGPGRKNLSPVYKDEIMKRAEFLIEILSPEVPLDLQPFFGRLISVNEVVEVMGIAERLQVGIETTPVNGGWIVLMGGEYTPPKRKKVKTA